MPGILSGLSWISLEICTFYSCEVPVPMFMNTFCCSFLHWGLLYLHPHCLLFIKVVSFFGCLFYCIGMLTTEVFKWLAQGNGMCNVNCDHMHFARD